MLQYVIFSGEQPHPVGKVSGVSSLKEKVYKCLLVLLSVQVSEIYIYIYRKQAKNQRKCAEFQH